MEQADIPSAPALPLAPPEYNGSFVNQHSNVLRLFFNRVVSALTIIRDNAQAPEMLSFKPSAEPTSPSAGDVYYDSTTNKLRCYNGTIWNDLF